MNFSDRQLLQTDLQQKNHRLEAPEDLDALLDELSGARVVMLGEASHGTHEYYTWRAQISKRLIEEHGFNFICVEGDWPDCYEINRYVKKYDGTGPDAESVLRKFDRWPTWMWANWEVVAFTEWLYRHNLHRQFNELVGFYGLDVYSLWESLDSIINYLEKEDPEAAEIAKKSIHCFEPYRDEEDGVSYARATRNIVPASCQKEVLQLLQEMSARRPKYEHDSEAAFSAEQNALVAVNAEKYYRAMMQPGPDSWNVRDKHMMETLDRLLNYHGKDSKAIVWEHNTHIGDARATDMANSGLYNIGQLARERYGKEAVRLVGFGCYQGSVIAGDSWGAEMEEMPVPKAKDGSWEALLHELAPYNRYYLSTDLQKSQRLRRTVPHRAIGVVYHPERERYGNYVPSIIPNRYDAFVYLDQARALHPLKIASAGGKTPETFPWNV
ncbi:erythromycin esterase family protein [Nafulsella turpanensis]|uniref:erythromycin esterase family protein n=1 Tax=Nafulsella turpanensis TaxID=1265690 RepID=UPI000348E6E3|nr:erythromycin esterase family protein [Nafulsella turpanensis]